MIEKDDDFYKRIFWTDEFNVKSHPNGECTFIGAQKNRRTTKKWNLWKFILVAFHVTSGLQWLGTHMDLLLFSKDLKTQNLT